MPECEREHDPEVDECLIVRTLTYAGDEILTVTLDGTPCDHATVDFEGFLTDPEHLAWLGQLLAELAPTFARWRAEANCVGHDHTGDEAYGSAPSGDDDDDEWVCDLCGADATLAHIVDGGRDLWLCGGCCLLEGYEPPLGYVAA